MGKLLGILKGQTGKFHVKKNFKLLELDWNEIDIVMLAKGIGFLLAVAYCFYGNFLIAIIISPLLLAFLKNEIEDKKRKKVSIFTEKFKEAMLAVSFALDVGYSIENAFTEAAIDLEKNYGKDDEMTREFYNIRNRIRSNENIETVIEEFAIKSNIEDIKYFAEVFKYAKRSGGNLIQIIKNTSSQIQEKWYIASEIDTMISGKKMEQRVMECIPLVMVIYLKVTSVGYLECLYGNPLGVVIMSICLVLYMISIRLSQKIMNIEV
ncbi:type II secretion system F family protein [Lachnospira multipara]|uniref:type II secretion system F family protein n=1 Tax=Lachnospira multipara TaxID=28051 RepID=UPI0018CC2576|nr:type II secretion system F family protein [Lachnospira multipara]